MTAWECGVARLHNEPSSPARPGISRDPSIESPTPRRTGSLDHPDRVGDRRRVRTAGVRGAYSHARSSLREANVARIRARCDEATLLPQGKGGLLRRKSSSQRRTPRIHLSNSPVRCEHLPSNPCREERVDCFVASAFARRRASADKRAPRNDGQTRNAGQTWLIGLAAPSVRALRVVWRPFQSQGARERRVLDAP